MKKLITIIILLLPVCLFSQQLKYATGGTVYNSVNKKITPSEVRELMSKNLSALKLYNAGRRKKTIGNILFYTGVGLLVTDLAIGYVDDSATFDGSGNATARKSNHTLAIVGGVLVIASIPVKIGYTKKVKAGINEYNKGVASNETLDSKVTLLANGQGFGFRIQF